MKMKNILLSLALLGMTPAFAADGQPDAVAVEMPVREAVVIAQGLLQNARVIATWGDRLDAVWQYTKHIGVGALTGVGLGTIITLKLTDHSIAPQDMVPVVAAGCLVGGAGGAGLRWYRGDATKNHEAHVRALDAAGTELREREINQRVAQERFNAAETAAGERLDAATQATEEQRRRAQAGEGLAEARRRELEAANALVQEQMQINGEFRTQLGTLERQSHMSMIGQVALAYDAARAERLNLRLLTRGDADVEAARTRVELETRQGVLLGLGRQLWRANAPEEGIRALLPAGFQAAIEEAE
jgi:hypothetical protein